MMTLIGRLCALCAVSAILEMLLGGEGADGDAKGTLRMVCGLLMLHLTLSGVKELAGQLSQADGLQSMLQSLMK